MQKLKEIRMKREYSVRELSEKSKVACSYISELENGNKDNPSKKVMDSLAKALEVKVSDIFY